MARSYTCDATCLAHRCIAQKKGPAEAGPFFFPGGGGCTRHPGSGNSSIVVAVVMALVVRDDVGVALVRPNGVELDLHAAATHVRLEIRRQCRAGNPAAVLLPEVRARLRREIDIAVTVVDVAVL